ncbi:S8 family serine peptidase [Neobacillus drentensis]|uniref:S8 family serine peptidase n=1 Tax=Neobacillus drentensis TaxID=220684 RepID=UPI002FFE5514
MKYFWSVIFMVLSLSIMTSIASAEEVTIQPKISKFNTKVLFDEKKEFNDQELIVKFTSGTSSNQRKNILNLVNAKEVDQLEMGDFSFVKVPNGSDLESLSKILLKNKQVLFVEPNYEVKSTYVPKEPSYKKQWYLNKIQLPKAWDKTRGSSNITVAVIDGGVQKDHPDLKGKIVSPYNAVTGNSYYTPNEHATHVAGIIAASFNKKGIAGIAPNVKIMPINVFDWQGASAFNVAVALNYAVDHHADVVNMSLGSEGYSYLLDSYIQYARANGIVLVAAAGNSDSYIPMYPAALNGVIGVSATDNNDRITSFSNYGNYIDLAAPGLSIYSTINGNSYDYMSGTSMAAPVVAGVAALVLSKNPFLSPSQVESILTRSTTDLGNRGWDSFYGYGRIDAYKAVSKTPAPISKLTAPTTYNMTGTNKAAFSITAASSTKVSLYLQTTRGKTVRTIFSNKASSGRGIYASWDGKTSSGAYVTSGTYKLLAKVWNSKGTIYKSSNIKIVNNVRPAIVVSSNYFFSPKVSGKLTIPYQLTLKGKVTAVITDNRGKTILKILSNKFLSSGKKSIVWNGKDSRGHSIKDGTYYLIMSPADSRNRKGKTKKVQIKVDTARPSAKVTLSSTLFKMNTKNTATAKLSLNETSNVLVNVVNDKGTVIKKLISKQSQPGTISISWNGKNDKNQLAAEGKYRYSIQLKDVAGNITKINSSLFSLQDWRIPAIQSSIDFNFITEGMKTFTYTLTKPGKVSVDILKGTTLVKTIQKDVYKEAGKQSFMWDGTDTAMNQAVDGDYQFRINVVDKYRLSQTFTGNVHVRLTNILINYPDVVKFTTYSGSEVYYKLSQAANVTIEIFNAWDGKVRTIKKNEPVSTGIQYFSWDGQDDNGYDEYDDNYFYVITAQNVYGQKTSVTGQMTRRGNPSWLELHSVEFPMTSDQTYNGQMQLTIRTTQDVKAILYVYNYSTELDKNEYSIKPGENNIVYTKPNSDYLFYLVEYQDLLGNEYWYYIDEYGSAIYEYDF